MPRVSREHEERRRQEILRAALRCFARDGYHGTTMDDVVAEVGLSKGAVYQYFDGKEALFRALRRLQLEELRLRLERTFSGEGSVSQRLERGASVYLGSFNGEHSDLARVVLEFWSETSRRADLQREHQNVYATWRAFLSQVISEGIRTGEFRADLDPDALASAVLAISDGLTLHWAVGRVDPEKIFSAFLSGILRGVVVGSGASPEKQNA